MKWYKKQLEELKKTKPELSNLEHSKAVVSKNTDSTTPKNKTPVHNPVKLRNVNRPKTDSK